LSVQRSLPQNPHQGQPVRMAGQPLERARAAMLMVHGRGARAEDILTLVDQFARPGFAFLAPHAAVRKRPAQMGAQQRY